MNVHLITLFLLGFLFSTFAQADNTAPYQFFDNKLTITLDSEWKRLSSNALNKRYGKQKVPPAYAFANDDNSVSLTFTQYSTPANKKSMAKIHKSISNMLRQSSGKAHWKKDKVYTRLGTKIAVYEYEEEGIGQYQYNLTYVLPIGERLTFISFITTDKKYKDKWLQLARQSLDSIAL